MKFLSERLSYRRVDSPKNGSKNNSHRLITSVLLLSLLVLLGACTKKEEGTQAAKKETAVSTARSAKLDSELLQLIPEDSWGFLVWEGRHKAHTRLLNSPWAGSSGFATVFTGNNRGVNEIAAMLKAAGLDPEENETWQKLFAEAVFFAAPMSANQASFGAVFRSQDIDLSQKLTSVRNELEAGGKKVTEVNIEGGEGFSFEVPVEESGDGANPAQQQPGTVYLLLKDNIGVISGSEEIAKAVLSREEPGLPKIAQGEAFQRATAGFPQDEERFATGYLDLQKLIAADGKPNTAGVEALSLALSMTDVPKTHFRLLYDKDSRPDWAQGLEPSTPTDIVAALPAEPLLFVSIDGDVLRKSKEASKEQLAAQPELAKQLAFVERVQRLGIAARMAPTGQSLLPIPDFMLLFETEQPDQTREDLKVLVASLMENSPIQGVSPWQERKLSDGTAAHVLMSPLGFGVFMAASDKLVVVASTEAQLKTALGKTDGKFVSSLKKPAHHAMVEEQNLGNLYLNFEQVASLMENMGGLLAMYAPQDQKAQQFLQAEKIESLKKMGVMIGSVTISDGTLDLVGFYQ